MCPKPTSGQALFPVPSTRTLILCLTPWAGLLPSQRKRRAPQQSQPWTGGMRCDQYSLSLLSLWGDESPKSQPDPRKPGVFTGGRLHVAIAPISLSEFMRIFNTTKARVPVHKIDYNLSVWEGQCSWCGTNSVLVHKHFLAFRTLVTDNRACLYSSFQK